MSDLTLFSDQGCKYSISDYRFADQYKLIVYDPEAGIIEETKKRIKIQVTNPQPTENLQPSEIHYYNYGTIFQQIFHNLGRTDEERFKNMFFKPLRDTPLEYKSRRTELCPHKIKGLDKI